MDDCERRVYGHKFCQLHYQRWKKTGDPLGMLGKKGMTAAERFWSRVDTSDGPDACWPWTGFRNDQGYGLVCSNGKPDRRAHRIAYELANGPIPEGHDVLHQCDNPPCCNPKCLHTGTHDENMAEMVQRKRRTRKFTDEVMIAVLESHEPHRVIAERYGMSRSYIALIKQQYVPGMHRSFTS